MLLENVLRGHAAKQRIETLIIIEDTQICFMGQAAYFMKGYDDNITPIRNYLSKRIVKDSTYKNGVLFIFIAKGTGATK